MWVILFCKWWMFSPSWVQHGSLNVPIEHHPTIRDIVHNGYYKVMSNIPKMGHLTTPVQEYLFSTQLKAAFGSASPGRPNSHGLHWAVSAPGQEQDDLKIDSFWVFSTDHFRDRKNCCKGSLQGYSVPCPIFDAKQRFGWWRYIPSSSSQKSPELVQDVLAVWDNLEQKLFSNLYVYIYYIPIYSKRLFGIKVSIQLVFRFGRERGAFLKWIVLEKIDLRVGIDALCLSNKVLSLGQN